MARRPIIVPLIILLNVVVFLSWHMGGERQEEYMVNNFLVSWTGLLQGRWWTLWTSVFSHNMFLHIFINMFVLNSFGSLLEQLLGRWRFIVFYMYAGAVSSLCHCLVSAFVLHTPDLPALGASGAIAGLVLVFALIFPREKILLFAILPLPAIWGALAFVGLDLWGLFEQTKGGGLPIGHGAHLGGALAGVLYFVFYLRRHVRRRRPELQ